MTALAIGIATRARAAAAFKPLEAHFMDLVMAETSVEK